MLRWVFRRPADRRARRPVILTRGHGRVPPPLQAGARYLLRVRRARLRRRARLWSPAGVTAPVVAGTSAFVVARALRRAVRGRPARRVPIRSAPGGRGREFILPPSFWRTITRQRTQQNRRRLERKRFVPPPPPAPAVPEIESTPKGRVFTPGLVRGRVRKAVVDG